VTVFQFNFKYWHLLIVIVGLITSIDFSVSADEPFQLNAQDRQYIDNSNSGQYPAPQMVQEQFSTNTPGQKPLVGGVQKQIVLPPQFLGVWSVSGQRIKVEALPEFQASAENAFSITTNNTWEISGDVQHGYTMGSNTGVKTPLAVDKVQGNQAFIRYQHQVGNTMAQEAIVMQLQQNGNAFTGLEKVSIVKEPQQPARARVVYQLSGIRMH
jgi:hypothetical protein